MLKEAPDVLRSEATLEEGRGGSGRFSRSEAPAGAHPAIRDVWMSRRGWCCDPHLRCPPAPRVSRARHPGYPPCLPPVRPHNRPARVAAPIAHPCRRPPCRDQMRPAQRPGKAVDDPYRACAADLRIHAKDAGLWRWDQGFSWMGCSIWLWQCRPRSKPRTHGPPDLTRS